LALGLAGFVGRAALAGATVERRFFGAALARFFAGAFDARFFAGAFDVRFLAGALLARFFAGALLARFFAGAPRGDVVALRGAFDARFFVVFFVAMASPETSTLSESLPQATSTVASAFDDVDEFDLLGTRGRLVGGGNHPDFLVADRFEDAHHQRVPGGHTGAHVLKWRACSVANGMGRQRAPEARALAPETGRRLAGESPPRRIAREGG
jgi:hypothetical protein